MLILSVFDTFLNPLSLRAVVIVWKIWWKIIRTLLCCTMYYCHVS